METKTDEAYLLQVRLADEIAAFLYDRGYRNVSVENLIDGGIIYRNIVPETNHKLNRKFQKVPFPVNIVVCNQ